MYDMIVYSDASNWSSKEQIVEQYQETLKKFKSSVEGIIRFHEDRIEELIKELKSLSGYGKLGWISHENKLFALLRSEYESIMAIEHWLEDVI